MTTWLPRALPLTLGGALVLGAAAALLANVPPAFLSLALGVLLAATNLPERVFGGGGAQKIDTRGLERSSSEGPADSCSEAAASE